MDAAGGQPENDVAGGDILSGQDLAALGGADGEAGEVVVLAGIHARHFGRLAADQRASRLPAAFGDACHDVAAGAHVELAGGEVVEEEQRLGALDHEVVDAHRDKVDPDGVVLAGRYGDLQLGADAVGAGDEDRVLVAGGLEVEQGAESAQTGIGADPCGGFRQRLDRIDESSAGVDVNTGILIGVAGVIRCGADGVLTCAGV